MRKILIAGILGLSAMGCAECVKAQTDSVSLLATLQDPVNPVSLVTGTFKGNFIINTASTEAPAKGALLFMIMHRFGKISDGAYEFFGLDNASIRLGLSYGLTDRLSVTIGRSSFKKAYDGSLKYKLLLQNSSNSHPLSILLNTGLVYTTLKFPDKPYINGRYRTDYFTQVLLARKFSQSFSLQLTPAWLHYNLVPDETDNNNMFALGIGGRLKVSKRVSINGEYNYLFPDQVASTDVHNSLSAGIDIETGGHVFQLVFSNSRGMVPTEFLSRTVDSWGDGGIYFGFNISRVFNLKRNSGKN